MLVVLQAMPVSSVARNSTACASPMQSLWEKIMFVRLSFFFALAVCLTSESSAQEPSFPQPVAEHEWLKRFEGSWTCESKGKMGPDQPEIQLKGVARCRMLGGFWVVNEWDNDVPGATMHSIQTIGYDVKKKKYVGTWIDNMTNHMWQYEGTVADGRKLMLEAKGPNFMEPDKETLFRDSYEFVSEDEMKVTSEMKGTDGKWITFMTGTVKRATERK